MSSSPQTSLAANAPTQYAELNGRRLAYRSIGNGKPLLLCTRFRGTLDTWDPAFLDELAAQGLRVITFDYTGLGLSGGTPNYSPMELVRDPIELAAALQLEAPAIGGWSLGGIVAQIALAAAPGRFTHAALMGTTPPGPIVKRAEPLFAQLATKPVNDAEEQVALFFEPASEASRAAAAATQQRLAWRSAERSPDVPWEFAAAALAAGPKEAPFPAPQVLEMLKKTRVPVLHIGGDHDIVFPVENWYALNGQLPTLQLLTYPQAGHGPQHQYPLAAARYIAAFLATTA
ncbi:MAG: alpha/beta hydrolase [Roseateles sp.]|nr:MAG: alpha/beta hydrolase [Roseateles sp.]